MPAMSDSRVIPANDYRRERWKNGLGWTREIARSHPSEDWDWRLSIAEIEHSAAFSTFDGVDRELVLLQGQGVRLAFDDGEAALLTLPGERHRFAGERALRGELIDGPTHDFNLMWRRDRIGAELLVRPLVGSMLFFTAPGETWALHLMSGQAQFDRSTGLPPLWQGDTALLVGGQTRSRYMLDGGGQLLAMRLTPLAPAQEGLQ
ncbi:HutD family protein [Pseudoxanthomonas composti]|uniref:HutD family protein n=2 Tax=Pseudoxanthomonas composti TaxID=2137479 RepID=A0A4Q1JYY8_9GAMM|nr:HutD family protein [Pseudoxanthomonas composti]